MEDYAILEEGYAHPDSYREYRVLLKPIQYFASSEQTSINKPVTTSPHKILTFFTVLP